MVAKTRFYNFDQNNSGGRFHHEVNRYSCKVIIEAYSTDEANLKAEQLGLYWDGVNAGADCGCCGDRWYPVSDNGTTTPQFYGEEVCEGWWPSEAWRKKHGYHRKWMGNDQPEGYIHYANGKVAAFYQSEEHSRRCGYIW